jgi:hypothetical protein
MEEEDTIEIPNNNIDFGSSSDNDNKLSDERIKYYLASDDKNVRSNEDDGIILELGDIIQLEGESNPDIHEQTFIIHYIDSQKIKLVNVSTLEPHTLYLDTDGLITDESIKVITILNRSEEKGYARQNGLLPKIWVDIHFGGEIPLVVTGEITNLEEDMIEVTTFPNKRVIYINFKYEGIPEDLPIDEFVIRPMPAVMQKLGSFTNMEESCVESCDIPQQEDAKIEYMETGESIITIPASAEPNENIRDVLKTMYIDADDIFDDTEAEELTLTVEVPESQKRYTIDAQVNDMMDELLSNIPDVKRTKNVMDKIHYLIQRFTELRQRFSQFDKNGNIQDIKINGSNHKPLIETIKHFKTNLHWLMPVVKNEQNTYFRNELVEHNMELFDKENMQNYYYNRENTGDVNRYEKLYKGMNQLMTPFDSPIDKTDLIGENIEIAENIDAIVENLRDFYSNTFGHFGPKKTRFLIQRYNLDISTIGSVEKRAGKKVYLRKPLMEGDKMYVKSFLMLPVPILKFAHVNLPGTNILEKSHLSQHIFQQYRLLNKDTQYNKVVVSNLDREIEYNDDEKNIDDKDKSNMDKIEFLEKITHFKLDEQLSSEENKFERFLSVIIPKTRILFRLIKKTIKDKLSFVDVVKSLEPFMIYTDDITYQQYNEIRFFIKNQIKSHNTKYAVDAQLFNKLSTTKYNVRKPVNKIQSIFAEKKDYLELFINAYKIKEDELSRYSPAELLMHIMTTDNGIMYSNLISRILLDLVTPSKLLDGLSAPNVTDMGDVEKIKPKDCVRRFLTKKYNSVKELQKDNNSGEIYYDEEYDDTPYHLLKKYVDKKKSMVNELFVEFLAENLIQKHDCLPANAKELATTLIEGKKQVREGEYAILELKPVLPAGVDESKLSEKEKKDIEMEGEVRAKTQYYRRVKNHWVHDTSIDENAFIDTQALFCNIEAKCFKNEKNQQCESIKEHASHRQMQYTNELDKRFSITVEELEKELDKNIEYASRNIQNINRLREIQLYKANYIAYDLGRERIANETIVSPYAKLFDLILSQDDFIKKQDDIIRFVNDYCREPMVQELKEQSRWFYCKETNVKLAPIIAYELASAFVAGNYNEKQDELISMYGVDEGDTIYDKDSGFPIRKLDYSNDAEYDDEGFKKITHDMIKKDIGTIVAEVLSKKARVFDDETDQMVYNVFKALSTNMSIPIEHIEEFVLKTSLELIRNKDVLLEENSYNKRAAKRLKEKGKTSDPYPIYRNQTLITIVSAILIVGIQSTVPSIKTRRTFPGCVRSFDGYPLNGGIENNESIKYIACIIDSLKIDQDPWKSLKKINTNTLEKRIFDALDGYIMKRNDIIDLYTKKREYLLLLPSEIIPTEYNLVDSWKDFSPPSFKISITKGLTNFTGEFKQDLMETLRKGHRDQHGYIDTLKYKVKLFGLGMIDSIHKTVKHKGLLLQTANHIPFMENACCNEIDKPVNPIAYFADADPLLLNYLQSSKSCIALLRDIKELSKAPILYHPDFTGIIYPVIPSGHVEDNIYAAFIHYCKFDRPNPIPEDMRSICGEKPEGYNKSWNLEEKKEFLKRHGKRYTIKDLYHLMNIVETRNQIYIKESVEISKIDILKDLLANMDMKDSSLIEYPLRKLLIEVLDAYVPRKMMKDNLEDIREHSKEVYRLRKYLSTTNDKLVSEINNFINTFGNSISNSNKMGITKFLMNIHEWNFDRNMKDTGLYYDEALFTITNFMKNSVEHMSNVYPNIIKNKVEPKLVVYWGENWKLSSAHNADISRFIDKHLKELEQFKNDEPLNRLFIELHNRVIDLNNFIKHIPVENSVVKNGETFFSLFDKKTIYLLHSYCWYSVIHEYIQCALDPNIINIDMVEIKRTKRQQMKDLENISNFIESTSLDDEDAIVQMEIRNTDVRKIKERVCSLLYTYLSIEMKNKEVIDHQYNEISRRVRRAKDEEKKMITDYLEGMEDDERKIEDMLKKHKQGRWNVGTQKGVFIYDKDTYDNERELALIRLTKDLDANKTVYTETSVDADELQQFENAETDQFYEDEANGISHFGEDYMDQGYYDDEVEEDFSDDS